MFRAIELVADRSTKEPFPKKFNEAGKIKKRALDEGLICYPMQGTIDGENGDHILVAPPFIINETEINEISEKTAFNSVKKWDSLKHMELIIALEKEFKIKFDSYEIPTMINFKIISATISSHIESK